MSELAGVVAVLACTLFAGAALYINLVEHPARLSCGTAIAAAQWVPSYGRGAVMQASLAILATVAGLGQWLQSGDLRWGWGALLIFVVVPFTLVVIFPTNMKLLDPGPDRASDETRSLLQTWGRLHAVRTALSLSASLFFVWALRG